MPDRHLPAERARVYPELAAMAQALADKYDDPPQWRIDRNAGGRCWQLVLPDRRVVLGYSPRALQVMREALDRGTWPGEPDRVVVPDDVRDLIGSLYRSGIGPYALARRAGASPVSVRNVLHGRSNTVRVADVEAIRRAADDGAFEPDEVDEILLERVIDGEWQGLPRCSKHLYARELYARGYGTAAVARILHTSWGWAARWRPRT